jgi:hypothetical protein
MLRSSLRSKQIKDQKTMIHVEMCNNIIINNKSNKEFSHTKSKRVKQPELTSK